jgi:hypothetical protein
MLHLLVHCFYVSIMRSLSKGKYLLRLRWLSAAGGV